jgi:hypothetical protein
MVLALLGAACTSPHIGEGGEPAADARQREERADSGLGDPVEGPSDPDAGDVDDDDGCYSNAFSRLELIESGAVTFGTGVDAFYGLTAAIDGVPVGVFYLDLYGGIGSLPDGPAPGVYPIEGDDTVWSICAVCAWASFGVSVERWVMAQSGTVRIDRVDTRMSGSLENIELVEIDEQDVPIPGGCSATVAGISFDAPVE